VSGTDLSASSATALPEENERAGQATGPELADPRAPAGRRRSIAPLLVIADLVALGVAYLVTCFVVTPRATLSAEIALAVAVFACWVGAEVSGLYDRDLQRPDHSTVDEILAIGAIVTVAVWLSFVAALTVGEPLGDRDAAVFWALGIALVLAGRVAARSLFGGRRAYARRAVIVGAGDIGQLLARKLLQHPEYGIDLVGFVDAEPKQLRLELADIPMLGSRSDLLRVIDEYDVDHVVVAFSKDGHEELLGTVRSLRGRNVCVHVVPRLFEALGPSLDVHTVEGLPLLRLAGRHPSPMSVGFKRVVDVVGSIVLLVVLAPVLVLIALWIKIDSPGPVFFRQTRLGQEMLEFTIFKFRTMSLDTDDNAHRDYIRQIVDPGASPTANKLYKLERADAVTTVGRALRALSLDELPQLLNVLKGEMSLVGPRPCIPYETELFRPHHFERFAVPAGITGLWQVTARARSTFGEALELDVTYVHDWSFWLDVKLLLRTFLIAFRLGRTA
jgi:exopolysaccharide biosynthesis polyprenyl glycosylphosphotransferase